MTVILHLGPVWETFKADRLVYNYWQELMCPLSTLNELVTAIEDNYVNALVGDWKTIQLYYYSITRPAKLPTPAILTIEVKDEYWHYNSVKLLVRP